MIYNRGNILRSIRYCFLTILFFAGLILLSAQQPPDIEASVSPGRLTPGTTGEMTLTYSIPEGQYLALQEQFFYFDVEPIEGFTVGPVEYPEGEKKKGLTVYHDSVAISRTLTIAKTASPGDYTFSITASYQFCNENGLCYRPDQQQLSTTISVHSDSSVGFDIASLLRYLLFAFIGGVLLNIMPCVLPLLSVRALTLVNQSQHDRRKIFLNSISYAGGIVISFIMLAGIVSLLKISGELVGWGFQFQNPGFVIVLISVIFVFALAMFDVFVISLPGVNLAAQASRRSGYVGSFLTGVFAVLVATPCTAPFLGAALGFAFTQPPVLIFTILIVVGLGFSLPFLLLGIWPSAIRAIPKPGQWMVIFKELMGFLLLGTVLYLLNTLYHQIGGDNLVTVLIFIGILGFAAWLYGRFARPDAAKTKQIITSIVVVALIIGSAFFMLRFESSSPTNEMQSEIEDDMWEAFSPEKVQSLRARGVPVFINFYAEWCTTCKVNLATVLSTKEIRDAFREYGVAALRADYTVKNETVGEWIRSYGKAGVPVYVLYAPGKTEPVILPELLTKSIVIDTLRDNILSRPQLSNFSEKW